MQQASSWISEVTRGPNWLFLKIQREPGQTPMESRLAESVVGLLDEHFVDRVVLEMDELERLHSELIGELMQIRKGVAERGGVVRISGLSDSGCESLRTCNLDSHLPPYPTKQDAVMARVDPPAAPVAPHQTSKLAKSDPSSS